MTQAKVIRPQAAPQPQASEHPHAAAHEAVALVLFGATGDLAGRKLLPALFALAQGGFLPEKFAIVGVAINDLDDVGFRQLAQKSVQEHGRVKPADAAGWDRFAGHLFYQKVNFTAPDSYNDLDKRLAALEPQQGLTGNRLFYLAVAPSFFGPVIEQLSAHHILRRPERGKPWGRVVIEKPFGHDLASALELDRFIHRFVDEEQVYRIDHYLGKETVQNILAFRFGNAIFEPLLTNHFVEHVQITVAETVGMEGTRGAYYDTAGGLRDVVQNHMLQLLAYVTMNAPGGLKGVNIRAEKLRILRNLVPLSADDVARWVVRGQYGAGTVDGKPVPAYRDELRVSKTSTTESYVALRAEIDTWRWAGVPFLLRTGKRLPHRVTEIAVRFKDRPLRHSREQAAELDGVDLAQAQANVLVFRIQPDEGISLSFMTKQPGMGFALQPVRLEFDYERSFHQTIPEAYERLLLDAIKGFPLLFMHSEELDAQWAFVTPILEAWHKQPPPDFPNYAAGTWGPAAADKLLEGCTGGWRQP
jgi:glucose-6-phosphate 1-dehydrogenase